MVSAPDSTLTPIPFVDLKAQYCSIQQEIDAAMQNVLDHGIFLLGSNLEHFEQAFAKFCDARYAIGVSSGTNALHIALLALGIGKGDEVITVPNLHAATAESIIHAGATPVFVDIDEDTYLMNPDLLERKITPRTKAIIPVHLCGNACDMDRIGAIAKQHGLFVVEDACQAHGTQFHGRSVGTFSDLTAYSFYPGKNLGAYSDGGMITTNNEHLARQCRLLRTHGEEPKNHHLFVGYCSRLCELQSAILAVKLKYLPQWNERRRQHAQLYTALLRDVVKTPTLPKHTTPVFHLYMIRTPHRDALKLYLLEKGINTGIHYPVPLHLHPAYTFLGYRLGDFPVAERVMREIISLPMYAELTDAQIHYVSESVKSFLFTQTV